MFQQQYPRLNPRSLYIPAAAIIPLSIKMSLLFDAELLYGVSEYTFYMHENPLQQKSDFEPTSLLNAVHFKKFKTKKRKQQEEEFI